MAADEDWRCTEFRQKVISQIEEAVNSLEGPPVTTRNPVELESGVYSKAKTKVDYLTNTACLLVSIRNNLMRPRTVQMRPQAAKMTPQPVTRPQIPTPPINKQQAVGTIGAQSAAQQVLIHHAQQAVGTIGAQSVAQQVPIHHAQQAVKMSGDLTQEAQLTTPQNINHMANDDWRSMAFRLKIISQIEEVMKVSKNPHMLMKDPSELESQVYSKAKTIKDYLTFAARLLVYIRDVHPSDTGLQKLQATDMTPQATCTRAQFPNPPKTLANDWPSVAFRRKIISRIQEVKEKSGHLNVFMKDSAEMESGVYSMAKTKKDYLSNIARLLAYIQQVNSTASGQQQSQAVSMTPQPDTAPNIVSTIGAQGTAQQIPMLQAVTVPGNSVPNSPIIITLTLANDDWQSMAFRRKIISQIQEVKEKSGHLNAFMKDPAEMEGGVYSMAKTKKDYLSNIARLLAYIQQVNSTASGQQQSQAASMTPQPDTTPNMVGTIGVQGTAQQIPMLQAVTVPGNSVPNSPIIITLTLANDDWQSMAFRRKIISQIQEVKEKSGHLNAFMKDPAEMEGGVYSMAKTKKDYLSNIARLLAYIQQVNSTSSGQQQPQAASMMPQSGTTPNMVGTIGAQGSSQQIPMPRAVTMPRSSSQGTQHSAPHNIDLARSEDWHSKAFRQRIISHIVKEIKKSNNPNILTDPSEMEFQLYSKAKTRTGYLSNFGRLIFFIRDVKPTATGQQQPRAGYT